MTTPVDALRLSPDQLTANIPASLFSEPASVTDPKNALNDEQSFIGHERAKEALDFGLSMGAIGFNVFAMGEHGTGRLTLIKQIISVLASKEKTPQEWCYTNNFDDNHAPFQLFTQAEEGKQLQARINKFIDELIDLFPGVFDHPGYQRKKSAIEREFTQKYDEAISIVEETAAKENVMLFEEDGEIGFFERQIEKRI